MNRSETHCRSGEKSSGVPCTCRTNDMSQWCRRMSGRSWMSWTHSCSRWGCPVRGHSINGANVQWYTYAGSTVSGLYIRFFFCCSMFEKSHEPVLTCRPLCMSLSPPPACSFSCHLPYRMLSLLLIICSKNCMESCECCRCGVLALAEDSQGKHLHWLHR